MHNITLKRIYVTPEKEVEAAELDIDGKEVVIPLGYTFVQYHQQGPAIIEEGVTKITMAASTVYNYDFAPVGERAKWFRDELGQLWCKFRISTRENHNPVEKDLVWPADRVVCVEYRKDAS